MFRGTQAQSRIWAITTIRWTAFSLAAMCLTASRLLQARPWVGTRRTETFLPLMPFPWVTEPAFLSTALPLFLAILSVMQWSRRKITVSGQILGWEELP